MVTGTATFPGTASTATITAVMNPAKVPGKGPVKGVAVYDGDVDAFRAPDAAPVVEDKMYLATTFGWIAAPMGYSIAFTAGGGGSASPLPMRGDTLTRGAVTAVVSGVLVTSGNFEVDGNAVGVLYVHTLAGGNFSAGAATYGSGADAITLGGAQAATTLPVGVRYEFRQENFLASAAGVKLYGVSGGGRAFEYDGNAIVFINSGAATDKPNHLEIRLNRLFLSQPGGGIYFSSPGSPTTGFTQDYTSGNLHTGDECTGLQAMVGGALAIFGSRKSKVLYGNISGVDGDMELKDHSKLIGAQEWTVQQLQDCYFISNHGCTSLAQSDKFGDFTGSGLSQGIEPLLQRSAGYAIDSLLLERQGHYRVFFGDSLGTSEYTAFLTATFVGGKLLGWGRGYYPFDLTCASSGYINNEEVAFAGSYDGAVYKLETGNSFNGKAINRALILPFNNVGDKFVEKQWRLMSMEVDAAAVFQYYYSLEFNYSKSGTPRGTSVADMVNAGGAVWGIAEWSQFTWKLSEAYGTTDMDAFGVGFNMSVTITSNSRTAPVHTFRAVSIIYEPRRYVR
jgi:hypothetical protein